MRFSSGPWLSLSGHQSGSCFRTRLFLIQSTNKRSAQKEEAGSDLIRTRYPVYIKRILQDPRSHYCFKRLPGHFYKGNDHALSLAPRFRPPKNIQRIPPSQPP